MYITEEEKKKLNGGNDNPSVASGDSSLYTREPMTQQSTADTAQQSTAQQSTQQNTAQTAGPSTQMRYDPAADAAYQQALSALTAANKNAPTYAGSYDGQLADLYDQIVNRDKFSYSVNDDALYQQYAQQYAQAGRLAMQDTMGQAAALTGGYGSSYGQSVGQQQYDAYLQRLNDVVPELYNAAYGRYQDEGNALAQQYAMMGDLRNQEYAQYQDAYNRWLTERNYAQNVADTEYERGRQAWADQQALDERQYERMGDNRGYVTALIGNGYNPSDEELAGAGMTRAQANQLLYNYYKDNKLTVPAWLNEALGIETQTGGGGTRERESHYGELAQNFNDEIQNGTFSISTAARMIAQSDLTEDEKWKLREEYIVKKSDTKTKAVGGGTAGNRTVSAR